MTQQIELLPLTGKGGAGRGQGSKGRWNHMPTVAIRVPIKFAAHLLVVARRMDVGSYKPEKIDKAIALLAELGDSTRYPRNRGGAIAQKGTSALELLRGVSSTGNTDHLQKHS